MRASQMDQSNNYVTCIRLFCENYFRSDHAMKGSLVIMNVTPEPTPFQSKIIKSLNEDINHEFSVMIKDSLKRHLNASHVSEKAQNYFMFIVTSADVNSTVTQWKSLPTWNPLAQVLVLFTETYSEANLERETKNVLEKLLEYRMLNVNVLSHREGTHVMQVVTWFPYAGGNCASAILDLKTIDECEYQVIDEDTAGDNETSVDGEMTSGSSYYKPNRKMPKIPLRLHDCALKVASSVYEPYTFYDDESARFTKGIEVLLVQTISGVLKLKPVFELLNETRENRLTNKLSEGYTSLINRWVLMRLSLV